MDQFRVNNEFRQLKSVMQTGRLAAPLGPEYSIARGLNDILENRFSGGSQEAIISANLAKHSGIQLTDGIRSFLMPVQIDRDLTADTATAGGLLVGTITGPGDLFVQGLLATSVTAALGIQRIDGLHGLDGNAGIPKVTSTGTAYWQSSETTAVAAGQPAWAQISAAPRCVVAHCNVSRRLMIQAPSLVDKVVLPEFGRAIGSALDAAIVNGSGTFGQPLGILNTEGVASRSGVFNYQDAVEMVYDVEHANGVLAPAMTAFLGAPDVKRDLSQLDRATDSGRFVWDDGKVAGERAVTSNHAPAANLVFGDWSSVLLFGWGVLEIGIDRYSGSASGSVRVVVRMYCDVALRHPQSFSVAKAMTY